MLGGNHHDALGISSEVRSTLCADGGTGSSSTPPHSLLGITLHKLPMEVDPQSFLEMFKLTAVACGWPAAEWTVRLLPLMSGEAQTAALCLPASAQGSFQAVKKAVLDQIGFSPEDHRRQGSAGHPFTFAQPRWLQPGESTGEEWMIVEGLPTGTLEWVQCH